MSVTIPIGGSSGATSSSGGLKIPLDLTPPFLGRFAGRETKAVRAVAAAAAIERAADALRLAAQARDDPAAVAELTVVGATLAPVLEAVARGLTDTSTAPPVSALHIAAARAVDVDPVLVAIAQVQLQSDYRGSATTEALEWVASIEPALLERAARAGLRRQRLDLVPKAQQAQTDTRLERIEARLTAIEEQLSAASEG